MRKPRAVVPVDKEARLECGLIHRALGHLEERRLMELILFVLFRVAEYLLHNSTYLQYLRYPTQHP